MSEIRNVLEKVGERIAPKEDAFEGLARRRIRKQRSRRITAGVVALLVALAGSYGVFVAFRGSESARRN